MSCASIWPSRYGACQVLPRFQLAAGVARLRVRFILSARGHGWPRDIAPRARVRRAMKVRQPSVGEFSGWVGLECEESQRVDLAKFRFV